MQNAFVITMYVVARYLHIVAFALLLGGTLFYLWVVPTALEELKLESNLSVFARVRWVFRQIVFASSITILITGAAISARSMWIYRGDELPILRDIVRLNQLHTPTNSALDHPTIFDRPAMWFALHCFFGVLSLIVAVALVRGGRPPASPLPWMRINVTLMLLAILLATLTRNARMRLFESIRPAIEEPINQRE